MALSGESGTVRPLLRGIPPGIAVGDNGFSSKRWARDVLDPAAAVGGGIVPFITL